MIRTANTTKPLPDASPAQMPNRQPRVRRANPANAATAATTASATAATAVKKASSVRAATASSELAPPPEVSAWANGPPLACQQSPTTNPPEPPPQTSSTPPSLPPSCCAADHSSAASHEPNAQQLACCACASDAVLAEALEAFPRSVLPPPGTGPWRNRAFDLETSPPRIDSIDPLPFEPLLSRSPLHRSLVEYEWSSCGGLALVGDNGGGGGRGGGDRWQRWWPKAVVVVMLMACGCLPSAPLCLLCGPR